MTSSSGDLPVKSSATTRKRRPAHAVTAFHAVSKGRRYEQVADQIHQLIARGTLKPDDRLPAERELAQQFGVSRSSLRDAIRTLEVMGVVESRHGAGTVVRDLTTDSLVVPLSNVLLRKREMVAELLDVRRIIEPALAARAAVRASEQQIRELHEILRRQREKIRRGEECIEEDSAFHYAITIAANNAVVIKVMDVLMDLLRESRSRALQVPGRVERSYAGHRRILRAIEKRDPDGAEKAVKQHLSEIEEILMRRL
jgi:GntR family transcriptional repressor for pyruvate dehydrogenase complex